MLDDCGEMARNCSVVGPSDAILLFPLSPFSQTSGGDILHCRAHHLEATTWEALSGYLGILGEMGDCSMSTRERWIVYPLLFLTLGIAMRDKIVQPNHLQTEDIVAAQIRCNRLQVEQVLCGRLQSLTGVVAGAVQCNELAILTPKGRPTVVMGTDSQTRAGAIETFSESGARQMRLPPVMPGPTGDRTPPGNPKSPAPPSTENPTSAK
jgi:hypothetical protein